MSKFTDGKGQEWEFTFNVGLIEDIKDKIDLDLDKLILQPEAFANILFTTPKKLGELLYVLCEEQCQARGLDGRAFGRRLDRETLDRATNALLESLLLFYPRSAAGKAIGEKLPQLLAKMDGQLRDQTLKHLDGVLSNTAIGSPELPG